MHILHAIRLMREACALRHLSINTEKTYTYWLGRYGLFLKGKFAKPMTTEQKIETFLTRLAISGMSGSRQNQAFNALLFFYRDVLKQELGLVNSLRAKQSPHVRQCPTHEEVRQLLATVSATLDESRFNHSERNISNRATVGYFEWRLDHLRRTSHRDGSGTARDACWDG